MATSERGAGSENRSQAYGIFLIVMGAVLIGFMPTSAKIAYADGANALAVLLFRSIFGAAGLMLFLAMRRQRVMIDRKHFKSAAIAGVMHMVAAVGILGSIVYIDISLASVIIFLYPFIVAVVNHQRGTTRLGLSTIALMGLATLGLALALGVSFGTLHPMGIFLSALGAVAIAIMILGVSDISTKVGPLQANLHMVIWAAIYFAILAVLLPLTGWFDPLIYPQSLTGWIATAVAGLTFTFGYVLFFASADIIGTTRASVLSILEPVMIIGVAIAVLGERLSPLQWVGMVLVLGCLLMMELFRARQPEDA